MTNADVVNRMVEVGLNSEDYDAMDSLVAEDFLELDPAPGQQQGREGLKDTFRMLHAAFPDMRWTLEEQISEGNKVVTRFVWTGTNDGSFAGMPATGKSVRVKGVVIDEVENGMLVRSRILNDELGMLQQLGVIPAP